MRAVLAAGSRSPGTTLRERESKIHDPLDSQRGGEKSRSRHRRRTVSRYEKPVASAATRVGASLARRRRAKCGTRPSFGNREIALGRTSGVEDENRDARIRGGRTPFFYLADVTGGECGRTRAARVQGHLLSSRRDVGGTSDEKRRPVPADRTAPLSFFFSPLPPEREKERNERSSRPKSSAIASARARARAGPHGRRPPIPPYLPVRQLTGRVSLSRACTYRGRLIPLAARTQALGEHGEDDITRAPR